MYRYYKKHYLKYTLEVKNSIELSNDDIKSLEEKNLELKEKIIQPVSFSQADKPPIQQTSFCKH